MPIYLVRWPNLSVSLVSARNRRELNIILDEVSDPSACKVKQYEGPLFIDWDLAVSYEVSKDDSNPIALRFSVDNVSECVDFPTFKLGWDDGETGDAMRREITRFAFPHYAKYLRQKEKAEDTPSSQEKSRDFEQACKEALLRELDLMQEYHLRSELRDLRTDPKSRYLQVMDLLKDIYGITSSNRTKHTGS